MKVNIANIARWPSKVSDYLNAGRPIIATKISDFEELFINYNLGYLSNEDSPNSLSNTIQLCFKR